MKKLLPVIICVLLFASCKKESEDLQVTAISDYAPLVAGKYITYKMDSLVYVNFGTAEAHHIYEVKYAVTDSFTDLAGRKAFRIVRYIRTPPAAFTADNTFTAVNTGNSFELTENNLRYLKLVLPIQNDKTWKGNSAIDVSSLGSDLQYLYDWDYTYADVDQGKTINGVSLANTVTVNERDYTFNLPVILPDPAHPEIIPTNIASKDYSQEIYAKDIGLVYRHFLHWEYQLAYGGKIGYGVEMTMIDHN